MRFTADFDSGSIGAVTSLGPDTWELALRNDNDNAALPTTYRTWFYTRAEGLPVGRKVRLEFSRLGFREYFVPVHSYDGRNWRYFAESEATLVPDGPTPSGNDRLVLETRFDAPTVWIARTFPYTAADLDAFLQTLAGHPAVRIDTLGNSPSRQLPIRRITLQDPAPGARRTVWIHARTHPAETGPSFVLEGLLGAVLADDGLGRDLRARFVFRVVPMHNMDGVVLGNYRTNGASQNLETGWTFAPGEIALTPSAPVENRILNQGGMAPALLDLQAPVAVALNLHSSNSSPDTAAFFFPHFGADPARYTAPQRSLWAKQLAFIAQVALAYNGRIEQPPAEGGAGFLNTPFPETWWWGHRQDAVNAITLETTYGKAGFDHWVTREDLRALGRAVATAIANLDAAPPAPGTTVYRLPFKPEIYERRE